MNYKDILKEKGLILLSPTGDSMLPFIKQNLDIVKLESLTKPLKKYDVILFKKQDDYILHRIIRIKDAFVVCRGDNEFTSDIVNIGDIVAVMSGLYRKEKYIDQKDYIRKATIRLWYFFSFFRKFIKRFIRFIRR